MNNNNPSYPVPINQPLVFQKNSIPFQNHTPFSQGENGYIQNGNYFFPGNSVFFNNYGDCQNNHNPRIPPIMQQTAYEVHGQVGSPLSMIYTLLLSVMSIACQGKLRVKTPHNQTITPSLFVAVTAGSGTRKSTTYDLIFQPIFDFEEKLREEHVKQKDDLEAELDIWKIEYKGLIKQITKLIKHDPEENLPALRESLKQHLGNKPVSPQAPQLIYSNVTIEGFLEALETKSPQAVLSSSEGGMMFQKVSPDYFAHLNELWDGRSIQIERKGSSRVIKGARVGITIMTQPDVLNKTHKKQDYLARGSGFFARFLMVQISESALDDHTASGGTHNGDNKYLSQFYARVTELLEKSFDPQEEQIVLGFEPEAAQKLINYQSHINSQSSASHGLYFDIQDAASKSGNQVARIAAILHHFCGKKGDIDAESVDIAIQMAITYLHEFKKIFGQKTDLQLMQEYSQILGNWLLKQYQLHGRYTYTKTDLLQLGPPQLRKKAELEIALTLLFRSGILERFMEGKKEMILFRYPGCQL